MDYDIDRVHRTDTEDNNDSYTFGSSKYMDVDIKNQMKLWDNYAEEE